MIYNIQLFKKYPINLISNNEISLLSPKIFVTLEFPIGNAHHVEKERLDELLK